MGWLKNKPTRDPSSQSRKRQGAENPVLHESCLASHHHHRLVNRLPGPTAVPVQGIGVDVHACGQEACQLFMPVPRSRRYRLTVVNRKMNARMMPKASPTFMSETPSIP